MALRFLVDRPSAVSGVGEEIVSQKGRDRASTKIENTSMVLKLRSGVCLGSFRQPLKSALETAARIGADAVELDGRNDLRPQDLSRTAVRHLKKMLDDRRLGICGYAYRTRQTFADLENLDRRRDATRQAMSRAFEIGTQVVLGAPMAVPDPESDAPRYELLKSALADLANHSQKVGVWLAVQMIRTPPDRTKQLFDELPPGVGLEFDPASQIINGDDALAMLRPLAGKVRQFRVRDAVQDLADSAGVEVQLGRGSVDLPAMLGLLEEHQYNGHLVLERNADDAILQCAQSMEYMKSLF